MGEVVMEYMTATKNPGGPRVMIQSDLRKKVVARRAAFAVEYGVKGRELALLLRQNAEKFIRDMELQGLTLMTGLTDPITGRPCGNPQVVTNEEGVPYGTYSIHNDLEKGMPDELVDDHSEGKPTQVEPRSLEASGGLVDYHIIGVFFAPEVSVEIAVERDRILAAERDSKNPTKWGGGSATPNRPSISR